MSAPGRAHSYIREKLFRHGYAFYIVCSKRLDAELSWQQLAAHRFFAYCFGCGRIFWLQPIFNSSLILLPELHTRAQEDLQCMKRVLRRLDYLKKDA